MKTILAYKSIIFKFIISLSIATVSIINSIPASATTQPIQEPQTYNTQISQIQGNTAFIIANGNKYSFENEEGSDGWKIGEKCKVIIQDGRLLEVKPIPLAER